MKMILKTALMAAAIAGTATMVPGLASAQVGVSIGIGVPGPIFSAGYAPCGPGYAPCGPGYNPYEGEYYYDPVYFGGSWYHGPYRWREENGERVFFVNGGWHRNEWTGGAYPASITFHNGGFYRGGRYEGWGDADRINARFHSDDRQMARPDASPDRRDMRQDRQDMRQDRQDNRGDRRDAPHEGGDSADGPHN